MLFTFVISSNDDDYDCSFCSIDDDLVDRCDASVYDGLFSQKSYGYVTSFRGLDHSALLGSSMALDDGHFMVGSSGFGELV